MDDCCVGGLYKSSSSFFEISQLTARGFDGLSPASECRICIFIDPADILIFLGFQD